MATIPFDAKCVKCDRFLRNLAGFKRKIESIGDADRISKVLGKQVGVNSFLCDKCRVSMYHEAATVQVDNEESSTASTSESVLNQSLITESSEPPTEDDSSYSGTFNTTVTPAPEKKTVELPFSRTTATHKYCCICGATDGLRVIPFKAREDIFKKKRIFIPFGNRCCPQHLVPFPTKPQFFEQASDQLRIYSTTSVMEVDDLTQLLGTLSVDANSSLVDRVADFSCSEHQIYVFTGLSWENVHKLQKMLTSMRDSKNRSVLQALVIFLFKLRTGNSNAVIQSVFGLNNPQIVSDCCIDVIKSFEKDILSKRFGIKAVTRAMVTSHFSSMAKTLFQLDNNQAMIICDGTYIRHQKSNNNNYQRKSYSGQKKVPLCKPFTVCTTNGFIIDMLGPYESNVNDATILRGVLSDKNGLIKLLRRGDIFVLDRGFRDVVSFLEEKGFQVLMPALKGERNQLTAEESNNSRFATKVRWVVEVCHGMIKQKYRLLDHKLDNKLLPKAELFVRIASFLHNEFGKRLDSDLEISNEIIARMNTMRNSSNSLWELVLEKKWNTARTVPFDYVSTDDLEDFPRLTENDLKILFTGTFQLSQAVSYLAEMMGENDSVNLQYVIEAPNILKFFVQSRHINSKQYKCFIQYTSDLNTVAGIERHCCDCANGLRTVGCCSHIATIIYFLSHGRFLSQIVKPAEILSKLFLNANILPVIEDNSDNDD